MAEEQERVEVLFEAALEVPLEQRAAFVKSACPDSSFVQQRVLKLLKDDEEAGDFLQGGELLELLRSVLPGSAATPYRYPGALAQRTGSIPAFEVGSIVAGRFQIHRFIVRGGMGEVYEAWDAELQERVALKTIRHELADSPEMLDRFRREVKQARFISHPNICRVHELFFHQLPHGKKIWFLSMEFLAGFTLREHIQHSGTIPCADALALVRQIVSGLKAAHILGVVHRDLKTANIMLVSAAPGSVRAVITDFGLALNVLHRDYDIGEPAGQGTPDFMAPEQRRTGTVSAAADQYSLGVIMYEMITGARPVDGNTGEKQSDWRETLAKASDGRWRRVILRCLQERPEDRFTNLDDIVTGLTPATQHIQRWIAGTVAFAVLCLIALLASRRFAAPPAPTTISVLPFRNQTGDSTLDYLASGVTESLTVDLARMPGLQVKAASVAQRYRGAENNPLSAGHAMKVHSVVNGSVEDAHGNLRVSVELIDVGTGAESWGQIYEVQRPALPMLQHQISTDVAYHLKIRMDGNSQSRLKRQYSTTPSTYDSYLKGRYHLAQRSPESIRSAILDFQQAIVSDPNYAPAYAGLADCYSLLAFYGLERPKTSLPLAIKSAQEALDLDSTLAEAYASRALARTLLNFDWQGAEDDYKRAIELDPAYLQAHTWYALLLLTPQKRWADARAQMAFAKSVDPDSAVTRIGTAMIDQYCGQYQQSVDILAPHMRELSSLEPAIELLAVDYLEQAKTQKAIDVLSLSPQDRDDIYPRDALLATAYAKAGLPSKATEGVNRAVLRLHEGAPLAYNVGVLYAALGNRNKALDLLEQAYLAREPDMLAINNDPLLAPLRAEVRFQDLLKQMNLN